MISIRAAQEIGLPSHWSSVHKKAVHHDVKSTNILLVDNLEAKITNFGIWKIVAAIKSGLRLCATRGFRPDLMLSKGHYGRVFNFWLDEDTLVPLELAQGW